MKRFKVEIMIHLFYGEDLASVCENDQERAVRRLFADMDIKIK